MQIVVKLRDIIIDPENPVDLTVLPPEAAETAVRNAYGFLAADMNFEVRGDRVIITMELNAGRDEETARNCFERGMKQAEAGRFNKAVDLFRRVLDILPEHTDARRNLAMALLNSGRHQEGKDELIDVLRLAPDDDWALLLLGNLYARHDNDLDTAERFYRKALEKDPDNMQALTGYAAVKTERGDVEGAEALYLKAIDIAQKQPNPYYGLAVALNGVDKPVKALPVLEQMFDHARFDDVRLAELRKECREFYLRISAQVADQRAKHYWQTTLAYRDAAASEIGAVVSIVEDNSLDNATADCHADWPAGKHVVRYNSRGSAVNPHIVGREIAALKVAFDARKAGRCFELRYLTENPARADIVAAHARSGGGYAELIAKVVDVIMPRVLKAALDVATEYRLWKDCSEIRPCHVTGLFLHSRQKRNPIDQPQVTALMPGPIRQAHEIASAAWALAIDALCVGRTAFSEDYSSSSGLPLAREMADAWIAAGRNPNPGDGHELTRQLVTALELEDWLDLVPCREVAP